MDDDQLPLEYARERSESALVRERRAKRRTRRGGHGHRADASDPRSRPRRRPHGTKSIGVWCAQPDPAAACRPVPQSPGRAERPGGQEWCQVLGLGHDDRPDAERRHAEQLAALDQVAGDEDGQGELGELAGLKADRPDAGPDAGAMDRYTDHGQQRKHEQTDAQQPKVKAALDTFYKQQADLRQVAPAERKASTIKPRSSPVKVNLISGISFYSLINQNQSAYVGQ